MTTVAQPIEVTSKSQVTAPAAAEGTPKRRPVLARLAPAGRFLLHYVEMQIVMGIGMALFAVVVRQLRASPTYGAAFASGTDLWILGDGLFMTIPMVAWMVFRGHGWQHSLEMGAAMLLPGIAIIVLGWLGVGPLWLRLGACGLMCLGMLVYMLVRYDHFTRAAGHAAHVAGLGAGLAHH